MATPHTIPLTGDSLSRNTPGTRPVTCSGQGPSGDRIYHPPSGITRGMLSEPNGHSLPKFGSVAAEAETDARVALSRPRDARPRTSA
jgi:hypothetical protein